VDAIEIDRTAFAQARRRAADTLREVAQTLTSLLASGDITTMILEQLRRVVPYTTAALMLRDGNQRGSPPHAASPTRSAAL